MYTFKGADEHIDSVGGLLGSNLHFLEIPNESVSSTFFPMLFSRCPHLKTLLMNGDAKGSGPIDIRHPQLETLMLGCRKVRLLTIDCPNLTHLSTGGTVTDEESIGSRNTQPFPSFNCPRLTNLSLSPLHCGVAVWQFLAGHAPNIRWLEVHCSGMNPITALTGFKALQVLRVNGGLREIPSHFDFGQWPLLEGILLNGFRFTTVRHPRLKELRIVDPVQHSSLVLDCPFLEELRIYGDRLEVHCAENLNSWCPRLKRVHLTRLLEMFVPHEVLGSSEFVHETVEELECCSLLPQTKRIACPKLTKLVMRWDIDGQQPEMAFPVVECLSLLRIELLGYAHLVSSLPSILAVLPDLESLKICELNGWKDVVLEHSRIKDLVLEESKARSLDLIMPSLVHVDIGATLVQVLKVAYMEKFITVDFHRSFMQLERRRRVFRGGKAREVDLSDAL